MTFDVIGKATPTVVATDAGGTYTASAFQASATVTGVPADGTLVASPDPTITFTYTNTVTLAASSTAPTLCASAVSR